MFSNTQGYSLSDIATASGRENEGWGNNGAWQVSATL